MKLNLNKEIWQTTNQQPWVEALACGLITVKTRVMQPVVPIGATVFLHASKSRLWRFWRNLNWTTRMDPNSWDRGKIVAVAEVEDVGPSKEILKNKEWKFWNVSGQNPWNSAAGWSIRFKNIHRLKTPVEAKGFQAPFARAKKETIEKVLELNNYLKYDR